MSTLAALFSALITAPETTEFEVAVTDERDAESIRVNLVKRLSSYREQLSAVLPTDQLPKSLKMRLDKSNPDAMLAVFSIGERKQTHRAVSFKIVEVREVQAEKEQN